MHSKKVLNKTLYHLFVVLFGFVMVYPVLWMVSGSFKGNAEILRGTLGFDGLIVTDDLAMDAVKSYAQDGSVAVLALQAGNDMIVTTDYQTQIPQVIAAVQAGEIDEREIDAHVYRVLREKQALGLID